MNSSRRVIGLVLIVLSFVVLHDAIITGIANVLTIFRSDNSTVLEISSYKEKIELLEQEIAEYESAMNNLKIYDGSSHVLGKIALRDIYDFYDVLVIATDTKVDKGSAVVNEDGLVGLVSEASRSTAKVELLTGNVILSVSIDGNYGMVDGYDKKDGTLIVRNMSNYKKVNVGSEVVTSGLQEIDKGIHIGYVARVETVGVENIVYVTPSVDFEDLNYVMVIDK